MKTQVQNIQIALIFQNTFTGSFQGILSSYKEKYPDVLENVIPLPDDFPEDSVPRLEIRHKTTTNMIRFAKSRADIVFTSSENTDQTLLDDFIERILDLGVTIGRVGYVKRTIYSEIDMNYVRGRIQMIDSSWSDEDVFEASQRLNKKTNISFNNNQIICNNIASLTLGKDADKEALLLERDINTHQDNNLGLKALQDVQTIVSLLGTEVDETIFNM